ncbi:WXG100 family type VII secretion target [Frankia sp. R82]|uniref:WXG100 family type VII secretion target n=1 Tax=Frankia sp. R82 TaxID=2950553 RepID=UPI0020445E58|nr:WXG100 family type VII secretion target [Frankia sp. R82]MCM3883408.1 WXG100 family type VII secretion target [Frankia sp. R82]
MPDAVGADLPVMQQAAQHVYDVNTNIQAQLTTLITRLGALEGSWRGDAATSFTVLKLRWDEDARKLNEALRTIGDALRQSHINYSTTETTSATGFTRIAARLNG